METKQMNINNEFTNYTNLANFIELQRKSLIYEARNGVTTCLAATTKDRLFRHAKEYEWEINPLEKVNSEKVLVVKKKNTIIPEIWVCSTYTKCRQAFNKYLLENFNFHGRIPKEYHVDHSLPKSRFGKQSPEYYIRLFLISSTINCSYGAVYEKGFYKPEFDSEPSGGFHICLMTFLKVLGYSILPKYSNESARESWALTISQKLENDGLENWECHYLGLLSLIYDGYKNLNYEKTIYLDGYTVELRRIYN